MDAYSDRIKFHTVVIEFADLNAKEDFKRLTRTDIAHNQALDFEFIFPIPQNLSLGERSLWRYQVWGSDAMDCEGETMKEEENRITYGFTTKIGIPVEFVKNLYLYSRIKKATIYCLDGGDLVYANVSRTAPCTKKGCEHDWCDMVFQEWEAKYNWSERPHPLFEVNSMLTWIQQNFNSTNDQETGLIYHQLLHEIAKFRKLGSSDLAAQAKSEFERQVNLCGNAYVHTMVMLNEYERPPGHIFKNGQSVIYKDAVEYYLKNTQPIREIPRFPKRTKKK